MKHQTEAANLKKYINDPIKKNLNARLETYCYHDCFQEANLITNHDGIDIISHQLELKFEGNTPIFISWGTIDGWFQYSLCVADSSLNSGVQTYTKQDNHWNNITKKKLKDFQVYGYIEHTVTTTELSSGQKTDATYYLEPHLLMLEFSNDEVLGIANFCAEENFQPRLPIGDDIWIIFGRNYLEKFIKALSLEKLDE